MGRTNLVWALSLAGLFAPLPSSAGKVPDKPVLLHMEAALDIDRDGRVTAVKFVDETKVPDAIRQRAGQLANGLKFLPPTKDGEAVSGRTYASLQACVAPRDGRFDFTVAYTSNGPGSIYRAPKKPVPTILPISRLIEQGITRMGGPIVLLVSVDGKAEVESATLDNPKLQQKYGDLWVRHQREQQKNFHYRPELIDGEPIATHIQTTTEMRWAYVQQPIAAAPDIQNRDEQSAACKALRGDSGRLTASDSPFKRIGG